MDKYLLGFALDKFDMLRKIRRHFKPLFPRNICIEETQKGLNKCLLKGNIRPGESVAQSAYIKTKSQEREQEK